MSKEMICGQLYRVGFTGRGDGETSTVECLIVATSVEDAKLRFPYTVDLSEYASYRLDYVAKEPGRAYIIRLKTERVSQDSPDAVISRQEGSQSVWNKVGQIDGRKYQVNAQVTLYAKSERIAQRKLGERLIAGNETVKCVVEEVSAPSGYAVARDVSMYERASFVRG